MSAQTRGAAVEPGEWYAVGKRVAELAHLGHGLYEAQPTTVTRVSKAMIFTSDGRRFWRNSRLEVGGRERQLITAQAHVFRLVPLDNPHAARLLAEGGAA